MHSICSASAALPPGPPLADATDTGGCGGRLEPHPPPLLARHLLPVSWAQQLGQDAPCLLPCQPRGRLKACTSQGGGGVVERAAGPCRSAHMPCVHHGRAKLAMRITSCALEGRVQLAASPGAQSACRPEQRSPRAASTHAGWASSLRIHAVGMQADFQVTQTHPCAAADKVLPVQRQDGMQLCSTPGSRGGAGRLAGGCTPAGQGHSRPPSLSGMLNRADEQAVQAVDGMAAAPTHAGALLRGRLHPAAGNMIPAVLSPRGPAAPAAAAAAVVPAGAAGRVAGPPGAAAAP